LQRSHASHLIMSIFNLLFCQTLPGGMDVEVASFVLQISTACRFGFLDTDARKLDGGVTYAGNRSLCTLSVTQRCVAYQHFRVPVAFLQVPVAFLLEFWTQVGVVEVCSGFTRPSLELVIYNNKVFLKKIVYCAIFSGNLSQPRGRLYLEGCS